MTTLVLPAGLAELAARPNWVNCGDDKIPYTPGHDGEPERAKAGVPATWRTVEEALATVEAGRFAQVGYEFHEGEEYWGADIDHCRDAATGRMTPRARAIVMLANTYAEPSPSGTGVHIIGKGPLPQRLLAAGRLGKKRGDYELYGGGRYFRMSLRPFPGFDRVREVDAETIDLVAGLMWPDDPDAAPKTADAPRPAPSASIPVDDTALLAQACAARSGNDFYQRHSGHYLLDDKSADDWAYLMTLAFWTRKDAARMRRIALASGRAREKWSGKRPGGDWLDYTIARVCDEQADVYDPERHGGATFTPAAQGDASGSQLLALAAQIGERETTIATLEASLARCREEHVRKDVRIADLETTVRAWEEAAKHPDQTVGGSAFDIAEEAVKSYQRGDVLTIDGKDYARVECKRAAKRRSAGTVGRAVRTVAANDGMIKVHYRKQEIETDRYVGTVEIAHVYVPPEQRDPARMVLAMLPPATEATPKRHGGARRRIVVPQAVSDQQHPVRRLREEVERFYSLATDKQLGEAAITTLGEDYWTNEGEQLTKEEATRFQVEIGARPATTLPHWLRPRQTRFQDDGITIEDIRIQDETGSGPPPPIPLHGPRCRWGGCELPVADDGLCRRHAAMRGLFDIAAGGD